VSDEGEATSSSAVLKTLLVSDLVGSTKMVERLGDERTFELFGLHDRVARDLLREHNGLEIDKTDGFLLPFDRPVDGVHYAVAYHRALAELSRKLSVKITSRVGIHLGEVYLRENPAEDVARGAKPIEVEGLAKPMAARLMSLAGSSQTLLTRAAFDVARRAAVGETSSGGELQWVAHGSYVFKGVDEPIAVFEVGIDGLSPLKPPPDSDKVKRVVGDETVLGWRPAPGQVVPHRPHWTLVRKLGEGGFGEVWLARHGKTRDERVFKFCFDAERLRGLQREVTLFRLLKEALGNRPDIARILDWSFDEPPYFVESEFTEGGSLMDWDRAHGIAGLDRAQRLEVVAQTAEALAAAHSVGVLHKDLKPANILVSEREDGSLQARLTDFGIGLVTDRERLAEAGITMLGLTDTLLADHSSLSGTQLYIAPELLEGKLPTVQADVYALGVMLYQLVAGDLQRALAPGGERDIDDELLREDIAALVDGSPECRLSDASEAARRLRRLDERRAEREAESRARAEAEAAQIALERSRKRRKLVAVAVAFLTLFAVAMGVQSWRVAREARRAERNALRAEREAEAARQVRDFLIDMFEGADPRRSKGSPVTARQLLDMGAERIERELADQPVLKSRLTESLGNLYFKLGEYDLAEHFFTETLGLQEVHLEHIDASVAMSLLNLANVQLSRGDTGAARPLLERALTIARDSLGPDHSDTARILAALGVMEYIEDNHEESARLLGSAVDVYERTQGPDDPVVAKLLNNLARVLTVLGRYAEAEAALERALSIQRGRDEVDQSQVAQLNASLGAMLEDQGRLDEAEERYRSALEIRQEVFGPEHPYVANSLRQLGAVRLRRGDLGQAEDLLQRALTTAEARLGSEHQLVAEILVPAAGVERQRGHLDRAEVYLHRAVRILEQVKGPSSPDLAPALTGLALACCDAGRLEEAVSLADRTSALLEPGAGVDNLEVAERLRHLAVVLAALGRTDQARAALERAASIRGSLLGTDHTSVTAIRQEIAALQ